jgi:hypothetical protein
VTKVPSVTSTELRPTFAKALAALRAPEKTDRIIIRVNSPGPVNIFNDRDKSYISNLIRSTILNVTGDEIAAQERSFGLRKFYTTVDGFLRKDLAAVRKKISVRWRDSDTIDISKLQAAITSSIYKRVRLRTGSLGSSWTYFYGGKRVQGSVTIEDGKALIARADARYASWVSSLVAKRSRRRLKSKQSRGTSLIVQVRKDLQRVFPGFIIRARVAPSLDAIPGVRAPRRLMLFISTKTSKGLSDG